MIGAAYTAPVLLPARPLRVSCAREPARGSARPPAPRRARRVRRQARPSASLRRQRAPRGRQLLGLLQARNRARARAVPARRGRARARAAARPALQQDGRRVARARERPRPGRRVRLPRRQRGAGGLADAALRPAADPDRPLLEGRLGPRALGRGDGAQRPARDPALARGRRGVRLGPRASAGGAARGLGHLRAARARLHAPPERGRRAPGHVPGAGREDPLPAASSASRRSS